MNHFDDRDRNEPAHRHGRNLAAIAGVAAVLAIASISAYSMSGKNAPVKPASGSAQAMALASSHEPAH
ncbi:hypothetical protein [Sphingobium sp.]|uniref:hypothetical protein n=1 Tax=Sphingobium sp. TaxID=1912891 RepID=UPI003BB5F03C